jgi:hypothetical protein
MPGGHWGAYVGRLRTGARRVGRSEPKTGEDRWGRGTKGQEGSLGLWVGKDPEGEKRWQSQERIRRDEVPGPGGDVGCGEYEERGGEGDGWK